MRNNLFSVLIFLPASFWFILLDMPVQTVNAQSTPLAFQSSEEQTSLLELYTSEGCSSCPPAEAWLSSLTGSPNLWKDFVPVAFHVDYWDYLGWRDPWAAKEFSDRQRDYARAWRSGSVYTPGVVLNGREWRGWSERKDGPHATRVRSGVLRINSPDMKAWKVSFTPASSAKGGYEAHAALLASGLNSDVKAGENRGHRLTHDFVVVALARSSLTTREGSVQGELILAGKENQQIMRLAIAVWTTAAGSSEVLQATGGWLQGVKDTK